MTTDIGTLHHLALKIADSERILRQALDFYLGPRELVGRVVLFSGGNDSTTLTHLCRFTLPSDLRATHTGHANTTIGIERTRQFVRDTSALWDLPLIEKLPPKTFAEIVCEAGLPGPAQHFKAYQRLKERGLRLIRKELVTQSRRQRVLFIAGRRRAESSRRADIVEHEVEGSVIWASPLANWTKDDLNLYREVFDVPRNPVADELGMSGECLCGAFAEPGEFERIEAIDPDAAQQIIDAEEAVRHKVNADLEEWYFDARLALVDAKMARLSGDRAGAARALISAGEKRRRLQKPHPMEKACQWGWGAYRDDPDIQPSKSGRLCSSCDARFDAPLVERLPDDDALNAVLARVAARKAARTATDAEEMSA